MSSGPGLDGAPPGPRPPRRGQSFDFAALLADPDGIELPAVVGETGGRPLAHVAAGVLAKLGGRYGALAERLITSRTIPVPHGGPASASEPVSVSEPDGRGVWERLDELTGLAPVKAHLRRLANRVALENARKEAGSPEQRRDFRC